MHNVYSCCLAYRSRCFIINMFQRSTTNVVGALFSARGTGMIASSSIFRPYLGRVIGELFLLLDAVYGIVRKH